MRILIVHRGTREYRRPFITEQGNALVKKEIIVKFWGIEGGGASAYLLNYRKLIKEIKSFKPDLIHAHYGLTGLFANFQRKIPVITTYHGSDINSKKVLPLSNIAARLSKYNIYVTDKLAGIAKAKNNYSVIPCGVDFDVFYPMDKKAAREELNLDQNKKYVLFSASFNNSVKNPELAKQAIEKMGFEVHLLELKGYSRKQVNLLFNAVDVALMTSFTEGSPQFIKEAMACNCPIVSTDVGSVEELIKDTKGCFLASFATDDVSNKLKMALLFQGRTTGRSNIKYLDNGIIADQIVELYNKVIT